MRRKKGPPINPVAKALRQHRHQVVKSEKVYSRKGAKSRLRRDLGAAYSWKVCVGA